MFENPRSGRQARNFTKNVPKTLDLRSSSEEIFSENCRWVPLLCHKVNLPRCEVNLTSCVARQPLCHKVNLPSCIARQPLCHRVNLPRCEVYLSSCVARQPLCHKVNLLRCEVNLSSCVARQPLCH